MLAHRVAVSDDAGRRHHHALTRFAGIAAHVQAHAHAREGRHLCHQRSNAARLVRGQRVHRVDDQRLDPRLARDARPCAMVQQRKQEALGLARACAGGHQRAGRLVLAGQPLPGQLLVVVAGVFGLEGLEEGPPGRAHRKRQAHLDVRALEPGLLVLGEPAHQAVHEGVCRLEAGDQKLLQSVLDVASK